MYSIWTTMYGIEVPEALNRKLQETEVSEMFMEIDRNQLPEGFGCDIPYSGDDIADVHLGVFLDSTESKSRKVISEPTEKQRQTFINGLNVLKTFMNETLNEWNEGEYPLEDDQTEVFNEFMKLLDEAEPSVYRAYSTS